MLGTLSINIKDNTISPQYNIVEGLINLRYVNTEVLPTKKSVIVGIHRQNISAYQFVCSR